MPPSRPRWGEHGRSFSVVAGEIKNLANQAREATGQVRTILGDIQKGINTSVMLTEEVVKRVDSGKKQSDVAERTIQHMAESLKDSIQAFQQITAATNGGTRRAADAAQRQRRAGCHTWPGSGARRLRHLSENVKPGPDDPDGGEDS